LKEGSLIFATAGSLKRFDCSRFVLNELQLVADSSDSMKRLRGRRGLDVLNHLQKNSTINIEIVEQDFPKIKGVDGKLVALAKKMALSL